jgi:hypothetical protein
LGQRRREPANTANTVYFYSDCKQSGSSSACISPGSPLTDISSIFGQIGGNFLIVKLIPESVFP